MAINRDAKSQARAPSKRPVLDAATRNPPTQSFSEIVMGLIPLAIAFLIFVVVLFGVRMLFG